MSKGGNGVQNLKCPHCGFVWTPKVMNPRACPSCKRYFDYDTLPPIPTDTTIVSKRISALPKVGQITSNDKLTKLCEMCKENDPTTSNYAQGSIEGRFLCAQCIMEVLSK